MPKDIATYMAKVAPVEDETHAEEYIEELTPLFEDAEEEGYFSAPVGLAVHHEEDEVFVVAESPEDGYKNREEFLEQLVMLLGIGLDTSYEDEYDDEDDDADE